MDNYEEEQIDRLRRLQASIKMQCILTRGFSLNLDSDSFYEHHTFLNLTGAWLHEADYEVGEQIKSIGGDSIVSLKEISDLSFINDAKSPITDAKSIYQHIKPDYEMLILSTSNIFETAAKAKDAATVAVATAIQKQAKHFAWEIGVMAAKR